jgi:hypothetical protein
MFLKRAAPGARISTGAFSYANQRTPIPAYGVQLMLFGRQCASSRPPHLRFLCCLLFKFPSLSSVKSFRRIGTFSNLASPHDSVFQNEIAAPPYSLPLIFVSLAAFCSNSSLLSSVSFPADWDLQQSCVAARLRVPERNCDSPILFLSPLFPLLPSVQISLCFLLFRSSS